MTTRLIERWLPIAEIGIESLRERTPMTPFPAPNRLHVWWARRPLMAARAAILASLLPADADRDKFLHAMGIHGDPVKARRAIDHARRTGERVEDPYGYTRAFAFVPDRQEREWFAFEARRLGLNHPNILDPTAGGGSIPFEAVRLGLAVFANDLNPVAGLILKATVEWPMQFGIEVYGEFLRISATWREKAENALNDFFRQDRIPNEIDTTYLWARTITCPYCEGVIPLSPNWHLAPDETGVRLCPHTEPDNRHCSFEIVKNTKAQSPGTVARGDATCPYADCGRVVDGDEIKRQAQAGGMDEQLYAVVYKKRVLTTTRTGRKSEKWVRDYRAPCPEDDVSKLNQSA